jgi:hypothetical protein
MEPETVARIKRSVNERKKDNLRGPVSGFVLVASVIEAAVDGIRNGVVGLKQMSLAEMIPRSGKV